MHLKNVAKTVSAVNLFSSPFTHTVVLVVAGVVLFPAGFAVPQVRSDKLCGSAADKYSIGACNIGWAYLVVIVGAFIALMASCLSCSTLCWRKRDRNANSYAT